MAAKITMKMKRMFKDVSVDPEYADVYKRVTEQLRFIVATLHDFDDPVGIIEQAALEIVGVEE
jgi:hypothetical protein